MNHFQKNKTPAFEEIIKQLEAKDQLRQLHAIEPLENGYAIFNQKKMLNLSSNDYLGLASDNKIQAEFFGWLKQQTNKTGWFTASSSRLLTGNHPLYEVLETLIANMHNKEAALVFNSGYHANIGILPAISNKRDLILSDKLNHASIIDGLKLCEADIIRYKHSDYNQIRSILKNRRAAYKNVFIISESIFSMDGDCANLKELVQLKKEFNVILYIDEAHAVGTRGENGIGLTEEQEVLDDIDVIVGTMGKALASQGAYIACSKLVKQVLINKMRSLIFTTGLPPVNLAWTLFIWQKLPKLSNQRTKLKHISKTLTTNLSNLGIEVDWQSNILPIIIGENLTTIQLANHLISLGFLVFPIRPPTVPTGTSRLRLSLSASIDEKSLLTIPKIIMDFLDTAK